VPREGALKPADTVNPSSQNTDAVWEKTQVNQCIGVSRGGRSTKIHAVVDALGNPIEVMLTTGNTCDITVAEKLLSRIDLKGTTVLADRAYGKWEFREFIANHDADFCIPPKSDNSDPWFVDWYLYKERHLVEKFFLKLKEFRRVAMRYDKLARRFLAFVHLACIRILLA
jgi:transposase